MLTGRNIQIAMSMVGTFLQKMPIYRIAGNFRWVLIFAISRTVYGVAKIKTAIIYININSKVESFEIAKIKFGKIISHTFAFKSRKFSSAKNFPLYRKWFAITLVVCAYKVYVNILR